MNGPGAVIRAVRKFRRIESAAFAKAVNVSVSTLYRLEHDDPRVEWVKVVDAAKQLGLEVDWKKRAVKPPPELPPEALAPRSGMRVIRVSQEVYDGLKHKAGPNRTVEEYLASHSRGRVTIRSEAGQAASRAGTAAGTRDR